MRGVTCPRCRKPVGELKKGERGSVHLRRMRILGRHYRRSHPSAARGQ